MALFQVTVGDSVASEFNTVKYAKSFIVSGFAEMYRYIALPELLSATVVYHLPETSQVIYESWILMIILISPGYLSATIRNCFPLSMLINR